MQLRLGCITENFPDGHWLNSERTATVNNMKFYRNLSFAYNIFLLPHKQQRCIIKADMICWTNREDWPETKFKDAESDVDHQITRREQQNLTTMRASRQADRFTFLGSLVSKNGSANVDIRNWMNRIRCNQYNWKWKYQNLPHQHESKSSPVWFRIIKSDEHCY